MSTPRRTALLATLLAGLLAACGSAPLEVARPETTAAHNTVQTAKAGERLGTEWGDEIDSRVQEAYGLHRTTTTPVAEKQIHYAAKNYRGRSILSIALAAGKIALSIEDERGAKLPLYRERDNHYLQGKNGQTYRLHYKNNSNTTYEIVASVDGLNVLNSRAASRQDAGYVLRPRGELTIEGFRKDDNTVAAFTFGAPQDAYAAHSTHGSVQNTGIIGTVVYELQGDTPRTPNAFPADGRYAPPPSR